jgi:hypothetical protein
METERLQMALVAIQVVLLRPPNVKKSTESLRVQPQVVK